MFLFDLSQRFYLFEDIKDLIGVILIFLKFLSRVTGIIHYLYNLHVILYSLDIEIVCCVFDIIVFWERLKALLFHEIKNILNISIDILFLISYQKIIKLLVENRQIDTGGWIIISRKNNFFVIFMSVFQYLINY